MLSTMCQQIPHGGARNHVPQWDCHVSGKQTGSTAHRLQFLQVLQLRLELVQVGVCVAAQYRAIKRVPYTCWARMGGSVSATGNIQTSDCSAAERMMPAGHHAALDQNKDVRMMAKN